MVKKDASLTLVLPIPNATSVQDLLKILNSYGNCVKFKDVFKNPLQRKRIVVGKVVGEYETYRDPHENHKKVYILKSVVPGDTSRCRFVACGKRMVHLMVDVFGVTVGDHLALYEPHVMQSAADLSTFYFPPSKSTTWVCKAFPGHPSPPINIDDF